MKNLKYIAYIVPAVMAFKGDSLDAFFCVLILAVILN